MTTENNETQVSNKKQMVVERIKAFAYGLIGSLFFTWGLTYFQEQESYRVPRLLRPAFELFGNIGLAVGLIIFGGLLMFYAYNSFKKNGGKPIVMLITLPLLIVLAGALTMLESSNKASVNTTSEAADIETEIANAMRPKIDNPRADDYFDKMEKMLQQMTKAKESSDKAMFDDLEKQYFQIKKDYDDIFIEMAKTPYYKEFTVYNAKISKQITELRER